MNKQQIKLSKFLSFILRHNPQKINLTLDSAGWVEVETLLVQAKKHGRNISLEELTYVVENNPKQRFKLSEDGKRIRASQGHSVKIQLEYEPVTPPETLFHGTAEKFIPSILEKGLLAQKRHHVHLSPNLETASAVGKRHGKLVLLTIESGKMHEAGFQFFCSDNGVWLTEHVPVEYMNLNR